MTYQYNLIPKELKKFYKIIEDSIDNKSEMKFSELEDKASNFISYIEKLYNKWFPGVKDYSDEHVIEQIFKKDRKNIDFKNRTKYEIVALKRTVNREVKRLSNIKNENDLIHPSNLFFLKEVVFESIEFLDIAHYFINGKMAGYGWSKRALANSMELFSASKMLSMKNFGEEEWGDFVIIPTSIFLIRQAIEIRLKNALGISHVKDEGGNIKKIFPIIFLDFLKSSALVYEFPVKYSIISKIHKWTQNYIHGGFMNYVWEIEWAQHMLKPLFKGDKIGNRWCQYGSIKFTSYKDLKKQVKKYLEQKYNEELEFFWLKNPEAMFTLE